MAVTKADLARSVAEQMSGGKKGHFEHKKARDVVNAMLNAIVEALVDGEDIRIQGFGTLKVTQCNERIGRNPGTGEAIPIPAFRTVRFKVADALKDAMNT